MYVCIYIYIYIHVHLGGVLVSISAITVVANKVEAPHMHACRRTRVLATMLTCARTCRRTCMHEHMLACAHTHKHTCTVA